MPNGVVNMGLLKGDIEKVPKGLQPKEYYARIYNWHKRNKDKILDRSPQPKRKDPSIRCYHELVKAMPQPNSAKPEDIAFVCREVIAGLMEWAYHEEDGKGVKTAAYAHYVLDEFYDGFSGSKTLQSAQGSRLHPKYSASECRKRYET